MEFPHVVILPFPSQGHVKPMFILAELLCQADFKVSFINTHHNHTLFLNLIDQSSFSARFPNFKFYSIPDGLPDDHPRKAPFNVDLYESTCSDACATGFKDLLVSICNESEKWVPATCIIADGIMSFAIDVGEELGIPVIMFRTYSATGSWVAFHLAKLIQLGEIPVSDQDMDKQITCIPELETILRRRDLPTMCRGNVENPVLQFHVSQCKKMTRASGLILNTFEGEEAQIISQLYSIYPKIYTVGPLHALHNSHLTESQSLVPSNGSLRSQDRTCLTWLDSQPSKSVIYVSFGSVVTLTVSGEHLLEFWHGLVNSGKPFLWVMRQDLIFGENGLFEIPNELVVGTKKRGFIVGWAPQEEVLAHEAVGGFLTHSGWNSTLESIWAGVPMVCWPQISDQMINSRCVSEMWKIGFDMKDTCDRSTVEKMVRDLMERKREEIMESMSKISRKARESVVKGGSSFRNLEHLINDIRSIKSGPAQGVGQNGRSLRAHTSWGHKFYVQFIV